MNSTSGLNSINYNSAPEALPERLDFVAGDTTGLLMPTDAEALEAAGTEFLTRAFQAFGVIDERNSVTRITRLENCPGGSTGSKLLLSVEYARAFSDLHRDLFVKFSRDFNDGRRDRGRYEMQPEVQFARLSRSSGFPIRVPFAYFSDFHFETGSGLIITERIPFGQGRVEPHRSKALDYITLKNPLPHYRAIITSLARIAGSFKSRALADTATALLPFDPDSGSADPIRYSEQAFIDALDYCDDFAMRCPQLLPPEVCSSEFRARFRRDMVRVHSEEERIQRFLQGDERMIALCHWNAHIDNAWFWRDEVEALQSGLIDWGRVGHITLGSALWGCLSAAENEIWDDHLDELLALFVREYEAHGGPAITVDELRLHLDVHIAAIGASRVLSMPEYVMHRQPDCAEAIGPRDPLVAEMDQARNCLRMYTNFLHFRQKHDLCAALDRLPA